MNTTFEVKLVYYCQNRVAPTNGKHYKAIKQQCCLKTCRNSCRETIIKYILGCTVLG